MIFTFIKKLLIKEKRKEKKKLIIHYKKEKKNSQLSDQITRNLTSEILSKTQQN